MQKKRKQYRYHELWNAFRNQTKFFKMIAFGNALPNIRKQIEKDLKLSKLTKRKVLALVVKLMEDTHIRIGNTQYAKANDSYGLTTMRTKHLKIKHHNLKFKFIGKKGKEHNISIKNKKIQRLVLQCKEIPGWELFQYYYENGDHQSIDSGMVNNYIHEIAGDLFSAKDFRTWAATKIFFEELYELGTASEEKTIKKNSIQAYDAAAKALGNTRNVCKKYYVHPEVVQKYENGSIETYFRGINNRKESPYFTKSESAILDLIKDFEFDIK
ncbi:DNA topoisomerase IB [Zhouia sp. PK063]|uniref:DNA topoisomerase IB n=1 Tax=Zhouia sp. PK063 TaxID=3373602 RepID=UPI0037984577